MSKYLNREIAQRAIRNAVATVGLPARDVRVIANSSDGTGGVISFPGGTAEGRYADFLKTLHGCQSFSALREALQNSTLTLSQ